MDENIYKIAIAAFLHDIGKFAERASGTENESEKLKTGFYADKNFLQNNMDLYQPHFKDKYTHKHAVYTAAFIDHIEKLLPEEFNKRDWGLDGSFINLAAGHHKPETPLQWVIAMADRISSGFDRSEFEDYNKEIGVKDYKRTRLLTIFEGIATDGKWKEDNLESYNYRYPLKELSSENIFPVSSDEWKVIDSEEASEEYRKLFFEFVNSLEKLHHKQNIPIWFEHFETLFMVYTSHIPAATVGKVVPDVSLYDHSKTTAALASAIYLYHLHNNSMEIERICNYEDKKFLVVTGNFYGVQDFIFSEGGGTNKAAAKLLRGRSFVVSLISELAADMLCKRIGLTTVSVVLSAAGKFTIIAPNNIQTINKIRNVEEEINNWLMKVFYGTSTIGISIIEASCNDFISKKFGDTLDTLSKEVEKKKYNKFDLEKYSGVVENYLDQFNNKLNKKLCPFCGKRPSSPKVENDPLLGDEKSACNICRDHIYIGTKLAKTPRIAVVTVDADVHGDKLKEPLFGIYQISLDVTGKLNELAAKGSLLKYWDIAISQEGVIAKEVTAKFINSYIPKYSEDDQREESLNRLLYGEKTEKKKEELFDMIEDGLPKSFHHIAKMALNPTSKEEKFTGIEAIGILKADVDNLGLIFGYGLKRNSLSRLASLSRQINYFFTIYLPHVLSKRKEFKDIYTVFTGGDDLFMIGPWNKIVEFASFLKDSFKKYVCGNKELTISAGISISKPGEPVAIFAERAEEALKRSKENGRDSITLFGETVKWKDFEDMNEIKKSLVNWMDREIINNAMLYRLNSFIHLAKQEKELLKAEEGVDVEEWICLKWRALLKYTLARNVGKELKGEEKVKAISEVEKVAYWLHDYGGAMKIPLWQILYNQRRK